MSLVCRKNARWAFLQICLVSLSLAFAGCGQKTKSEVEKSFDLNLSKVASMPKGTSSQALKVDLLVANDSTEKSLKVDGDVTWNIENSKIIEVNNGVIKALAVGKTKLSATIDLKKVKESVETKTVNSEEIEVVVTNAELLTINVHPQEMNLPKGRSLNFSHDFKMIGQYTDGPRELNIADLNIAVESELVASAGKMSFDGTQTINQDTNIKVNDKFSFIASSKTAKVKSSAVEVTIIQPALLKISLEKLLLSAVPLGAERETVVYGHYTDKTKLRLGGIDFKNLKEVNATGDTKLEIENKTGRFKALKKGQTQILVSHNKMEAQAEVTIVDAVLTDIILGNLSEVALGLPKNLGKETVGVFSDDAIRNATAANKVFFVWESSDPSVLEVNDGVLIGRQLGRATVRVSSKSDKSVYHEREIVVSEAIVVGIEAQESMEIPLGSSKGIELTVVLSNGVKMLAEGFAAGASTVERSCKECVEFKYDAGLGGGFLRAKRLGDSKVVIKYTRPKSATAAQELLSHEISVKVTKEELTGVISNTLKSISENMTFDFDVRGYFTNMDKRSVKDLEWDLGECSDLLSVKGGVVSVSQLKEDTASRSCEVAVAPTEKLKFALKHSFVVNKATPTGLKLALTDTEGNLLENDFVVNYTSLLTKLTQQSSGEMRFINVEDVGGVINSIEKEETVDLETKVTKTSNCFLEKTDENSVINSINSNTIKLNDNAVGTFSLQYSCEGVDSNIVELKVVDDNLQ
jgi:hypothetical protein